MSSVKTNEDIREYCRLLKLHGIAEHFEAMEAETQDCAEYLCRLLAFEAEQSSEKKKLARIHAARFPYMKYLEDLEPGCLPEPMRRKLPELTALSFIRNGQNLILTGNPGTGTRPTLRLALVSAPARRGTGFCSLRFPIW